MRKTYTRPSTPEEAEAAIERSKGAKAARHEKDYLKEPTQTFWDRNFGEIQARVAEHRLPFTLSLININEVPIGKTRLIRNQIMVMYRNGEFETLPTHVNGDSVKEYLGFRFSRVTHWCFMPMRTSPGHPVEFPYKTGDIFGFKPRDIFDELPNK